MSIAKCNVGSPVYVPAGEHMDGAVLTNPDWARKGIHFLSHNFAVKQEQNGLLEIAEIDGETFSKTPCCGSH